MNIYLCKTIKNVGFDEYSGAVVTSHTKGQARKLADTLPVKKPYRVNKIGSGPDGVSRVLLSSFHAG